MDSDIKEADIVQTLKEKLDIGVDEAEKIFHTIKDKLPDGFDQTEILNVIKASITKHPIKSLAIAFVIGIVVAKLMQKSS
jgi:hypothetical protein